MECTTWNPHSLLDDVEHKQVQEGINIEKKQNNLQQGNVEQQEKGATNNDLLNRK